MGDDWLGFLVCPVDREPLSRQAEALHCGRCGRAFPIRAGIPDFTEGLPEARPRWRAAQAYELAYWADRAEATGQEERFARTAEELSRLFDAHRPGWRRRALHVGPAGLGEIHFLDAAEHYALEPLACQLDVRGLLRHGRVRYVAGMGERLPFPDGHFSLILIPNMLDHVSAPERVLAEARRCLAEDGLVWVSCHVSGRAVIPLFRVLARLRVGYFGGHPWSFNAKGLDRRCAAAGFRIEWSRTEGTPGGRGLRRRVKTRVLSLRSLLLAPT